jgi:hypothetical protein
MIEGFTALLFAHVLADFVLQSAAMAEGKRRPPMLGAHGALVFLTAVAATGSLHPALAALALAHMAIDLLKALSGRRGVTSFLVDQAAHLACLVATVWWVPDLWTGGLWSGLAPATLPAAMAILSGALLATRAGGFAIGALMQPWAAVITLDGLPAGGRAIGLLERGLIFLMVLARMPEGIGFLIAAKSVLRFGTVKEEAKLSEYVIIGTLASFAWALIAALATLALLGQLEPLGIPLLAP